MESLPECIPIQVKILFFENQKREWQRVLEISEGGLHENPESALHWSQINLDAKERIRQIDEMISFLKINPQ